MSSPLQSLWKWPPQPSTVVGLAALAGLIAHVTTGNPIWDTAAAAAVAVLVPDNSAAVDEVRSLIAAALDIVAKTRPILVVVLMLGAGLGLAACQNAGAGTGTVTGGASGGWQQALGQFTVTDLQTAETDATAHGDAVAATCYTALIPIVQGLAGSNAAAGIKGAVTVFQAARDLANAGQSTTLHGLNVACAPLLLDAEATALALAAKIGIAAAPLALPLPLP